MPTKPTEDTIEALITEFWELDGRLTRMCPDGFMCPPPVRSRSRNPELYDQNELWHLWYDVSEKAQRFEDALLDLSDTLTEERKPAILTALGVAQPAAGVAALSSDPVAPESAEPSANGKSHDPRPSTPQ
jgi:hypothetical protein